MENRYNATPFNATAANQKKKRKHKAYINIHASAGFGRNIKRNAKHRMLLNAESHIVSAKKHVLKTTMNLQAYANLICATRRELISETKLLSQIYCNKIFRRRSNNHIDLESSVYCSTIFRRISKPQIILNTNIYLSKNTLRSIRGIGILNSYASMYPIKTSESLLNIKIPVGSTLMIDSKNQKVLLDGVDVTYYYEDDWFILSRFLLELVIRYDGDPLAMSGLITGIEMWL